MTAGDALPLPLPSSRGTIHHHHPGGRGGGGEDDQDRKSNCPLLTAASGHRQLSPAALRDVTGGEKKRKKREEVENGGLHFSFQVSGVHVSSTLKRQKRRAATVVGCESSRSFVGVGWKGREGGGTRVGQCRHVDMQVFVGGELFDLDGRGKWGWKRWVFFFPFPFLSFCRMQMLVPGMGKMREAGMAAWRKARPGCRNLGRGGPLGLAGRRCSPVPLLLLCSSALRSALLCMCV